MQNVKINMYYLYSIILYEILKLYVNLVYNLKWNYLHMEIMNIILKTYVKVYRIVTINVV
jgi:hypothetical protein